MFNKIKTIQVNQSSFFINDLFNRSFKSNPPSNPKHFILFAEGNNSDFYPIGYLHFSRNKNVYLGGGMCIDKYLLRKLPKSTLAELKKSGGVAYFMLSSAVNQLENCDAVFGYVGDLMAKRVDFSVGFEMTKYQYLIVYWKKQLSSKEQNSIIDRIAKVGPF